MIKSKTLKVLEYDKILEMLSKKAESQKAKKIIYDYTPSPSFEYALTLQQETSEAYDILFNYSLNPSFSVDDISVILQSARKMSLLSMADLLKIARVLRVARNLKTTVFKAETYKIPLIKSYVDGIYTNQNLELDIEKSILTETEMSDYASKELKSIRDAIKRQNEKIRQKLNSYVTSSTYQKALQDNIVTIRKDRFVLPVKAEYKNMIDGIVHDESSSGATVYIEPMAIVNLNNEIVSLKVQEQAEIIKVLQAFTVVVSGESETIERNFDIIT
ncbi:MAG: endonuclease MutS2, partial [Clostridia bacterium]|nr:endonuclease MutS2 [Clostridia bacterium]